MGKSVCGSKPCSSFFIEIEQSLETQSQTVDNTIDDLTIAAG
jgi:hypothetical protein